MTKPTVAGNAYRWAHPAIEQMVRQRPAAALDFLQADTTTKHYVALAVRGWETHQGRSEQVLRRLAGDIFLRPRPIVLAEIWGTGFGKLTFLKRLPGRVLPRRQYAELPSAPDRAMRLRDALIEPLSHVHGVSNKVLSMALADLLLAGDPGRVLWTEAGAVMIAVDTLVHNFLHRTGILRRLGAQHLYGPTCYAPDGCGEILERIAATIDARRFNPAFPANFPRFVQHAVWRFCAESGLDECNGRQIDDRARCGRRECPVFRMCDRIALKREMDLQDD